MGTVLRRKNSRLVRIGVVLALAVVSGLGLLAYQTLWLQPGSALSDLNFDIGALWNGNEEVSLGSISDSDIVIKVLPPSDRLKAIHAPQLPVELVRGPVQFSKKLIDLPMPDAMDNKPSFHVVDDKYMERVSLIELPMTELNTLEFLYMQQLQNDYLIAKDLDPRRGKWSVALSFAPSISYRTYQYGEDVAGTNTIGNTRYTYGMTEGYRNTTDEPLTSYYAGLDLAYNVNSHLSISLGAYYSMYGETIALSKLHPDDKRKEGAVFEEQSPLYNCPDNVEETEHLEYNNKYSTIEIPIKARLTILRSKKTDLAVEVGAYLQRLHQASAMVYDFRTDYYYWLADKNQAVFQQRGIGSIIGMSLSQFIGNTTEVFVNPQFKFNLTSTFTDAYPVEQKQYSAGLQFGLRKHFDDIKL